MKKVVYIMNVDWNWIKQRPHFIAERIADASDTLILYQHRYNRRNLQKRDSEGLKLKALYSVPKLSGIPRLRWINDRLLAFFARRAIKKAVPDIIYTTYPTQISMIPEEYKGMAVYDCMDNHTAFCYDKKTRESLEASEKKLMQRAGIVFVTSEYLLQEVYGRYHIPKNKLLLVRNAYDGKIIDCPPQNPNHSPKFKMAYVGTISSWFDWKTVLCVLDENRNAEIHLFGPIENTCVPDNEAIVYHGVTEHTGLYDAIKDMDCLIMPFIINKIIEAVDPVKLYEYINFNKNIIACRYKEIERFHEFVHFYNTPSDFSGTVKRLQINNAVKYNNEQRMDFLRNNSWDNRAMQIMEALEI